MADRDYNLHYRADNTGFQGPSNVVARTLMLINSLVDRLVPKLKAIYMPLSRSASSAAASNQKLADSLGQVSAAANTTAGAVSGLRGATAGVGTASRSASNSLGMMAARMLALAAAHEVLSTLRDMFEEIRDRAKETADYVADLRDSSRELGNLMGREGADETVIRREAETALTARVSIDQARDFLQQYMGVENIGIEKGNIDKATSEALAKEGLAFAHRINVPEGTAGKVIGRIAQFQKVPDAAAGMEQLAQMAYGISQGKGEYKEGFKALDKLAPTVVGQAGGVKTGGEAAVMLGVYSQIAGSFDQAQQMMVQTRRLLNETQGDKGAYLKKIGITPEMDLREKLAVLAPHVAGPGGDTMLSELGFNLARQREVTIAATKQLDVMDIRMKKVQESEAQGGLMGRQATAETQSFLRTDEGARNQAAKTVQEVQKVIEGQELGPARRLRMIAEARLRQTDPAFRGPANLAAEKATEVLTSGAGGGINMTLDLDEKAGVVPMLLKEASRVGLDVGTRGRGLRGGGFDPSPSRYPGLMSNVDVIRQRQISRLARDIEARGGSPEQMEVLEAQQRNALGLAAGQENERRRLRARAAGGAAPGAAAGMGPQANLGPVELGPGATGQLQRQTRSLGVIAAAVDRPRMAGVGLAAPSAGVGLSAPDEGARRLG